MGYIFIFCRGPISWQSRKQPTIALSTMEAEYMALSDAIRELLSRMYYLTELGISLIQPTIAYTDNQAAIALADGEGDYRRAKHIDIRYHFIREHLQRGTVEINYISFRKATSRLPYEGPSYIQTQRLHQRFATRFLRVFSASPSASHRCDGPHNMGFFLIFTSFVFSCVYVFFAFATVWYHHFRVFFEEGMKQYHQPIGASGVKRTYI
jgi:hypothetical protein